MDLNVLALLLVKKRNPAAYKGWRPIFPCVPWDLTTPGSGVGWGGVWASGVARIPKKVSALMPPEGRIDWRLAAWRLRSRQDGGKCALFFLSYLFVVLLVND